MIFLFSSRLTFSFSKGNKIANISNNVDISNFFYIIYRKKKKAKWKLSFEWSHMGVVQNTPGKTKKMARDREVCARFTLCHVVWQGRVSIQPRSQILFRFGPGDEVSADKKVSTWNFLKL